MENKKVIIIGGGPAGLEAAYNLAISGHQVTLLRKMKKLVVIFANG